MVRAIGSDPGTSSLDLLLLDDGAVVDQKSFLPGDLAERSRTCSSRLFAAWAPIDLVAAPSGYGLPLVRGDAFTEDHLEQMSLVRPDERDRPIGGDRISRLGPRVSPRRRADRLLARRSAPADDPRRIAR